MAKDFATKSVLSVLDSAADIEYEIRHIRKENLFCLYKHSVDDNGKSHCYLIKKKAIIDYKKDLSDFRKYIYNELIGRKTLSTKDDVQKDSNKENDEKWVDIPPRKKNTPKLQRTDIEWKDLPPFKKTVPEIECGNMEWIDVPPRKKAAPKIQGEDTEWVDYVPAKRKRTKRISDVDILPPCQLSDLKMTDLESLFIEWEKAQQNEPDWLWEITNGGNHNIGKNHFRRDGIIDEDTFRNERVKVLFISSEANDNDYSAAVHEKMNTVEDYRKYYRTGIDDWEGQMRVRIAEMYKLICGIERKSLANNEAANRFAVMDINKRGGGSSIKGGKHLNAYCRYYAPFIRKEIEIIDPDIVAIIGKNLYHLDFHRRYLGAIEEDRKCYFELNGKRVPILSLYQTSVFQGKEEPLPGYEDDRIIGKQATVCAKELKRFGI